MYVKELKNLIKYAIENDKQRYSDVFLSLKKHK